VKRSARIGTAALAGLASAWSGSAEAHVATTRLGDFYAGALHPLTDLQTVLLWLAIGVLAGSLGRERGRLLVPLMPAGLLAGLAFALLTRLPAPGPGFAAAAILVAGLLAATALRIGPWTLGAVGVASAALCGASNAAGVGPETDSILFALGLATSGYAFITLMMALTVLFLRPAPAADRTAMHASAAQWRGVAVRALGSWISAVGLLAWGWSLLGH
jgi:hydrogenase/urease accessory protein HupE